VWYEKAMKVILQVAVSTVAVMINV
jgi:hypothetical protein